MIKVMVIIIGKFVDFFLFLLDIYYLLKSLSLGMNNLLGFFIFLVFRFLNLMFVVRVFFYVVVVLKFVIFIGI